MANIYDVIIIGGGPGGLAASIYANRAGYNTLIIEKIGFGGQMVLTDYIDNYPGFPDGIHGYEIQEKMVKQAEKFGMKHKFESVLKVVKNDNIFTVSTEKYNYQALTIIIATGAKHRILDIPGEREFSSRGVSYCATCDVPFFKDKDVIVVGGGDSALTEAAFLSKFAKTVKIIHRKERFRAVNSLVEDASKIEKISFLFNSTVTEIKGDNVVKKIVIKDIKTNEEREEVIDGVFIFIGLDPNTEFVDKSILDHENHIITDHCMETKIVGMYAVGDVRSGAFRQIVCAVASGATAAEYAGKYIDKLKGNEYK
jgi:thioredoxin reductase (NADPH)